MKDTDVNGNDGFLVVLIVIAIILLIVSSL